VVLDDLRSGDAHFVADAALVEVDVGERSALDRVLAMRGPFDAVLHFAAYASVADSVAHPLRTYANNVAASRTLLERSIEYGVRAFVFSSSAAVYGAPTRQPIPESEPLAPTNPYGASKAMVERMLVDAEAAHGIRTTSLRYFNAAGADPGGGIGECHEPETHLVPLALEATAGLRPELVLYGSDYPTRDGTCVRDYIHVSDLAQAHALALDALLGGGPSGIYNLGTGRGHTNREVLAAVERVVGRPVPTRPGPRRPGDPPELVADGTRFRRDTGFEPHLSSLETIVATAAAWLAERGES
jgi:UDP-glucose-4-epimerase GalE